MNAIKLFLAVLTGMLLAACGGGGGGGGSSATVPGAPTAVKIAAGTPVGTTAVLSFTAPASDGGSAITGYTVTANQGGITASRTASPITLTGLTSGTAYTFSVVATNSVGSGAAATVNNINTYNVVETFYEPDTQPNNSIFTGSFTYDSLTQTVSNLTGSLTEAMTKVSGCTGMGCPYGGPMTTVTLANQLSAASDTTLGGQLVTTFALNTTDVFSGGGFAPGSSTTYGNSNAYAMIFVNTTDPTAALTQAQIDRLAYADCTAGGLMATSCMTGLGAWYWASGVPPGGTMGGFPEPVGVLPTAQVITKQ